MNKPVKPKKPAKAKKPINCPECNGRGQVKEYGPYGYDWDYVPCKDCNGCKTLSADVQNEKNTARYERQLAAWTKYRDAVRVLQKIKLTHEQVKAIQYYGFHEFIKDFHTTPEPKVT